MAKNAKTFNIKVLLNCFQCSSECLALISKAQSPFLLYRVVPGKTARKQIWNLLSTMGVLSWFLLSFELAEWQRKLQVSL